ncbi:MAG: hypothetical protein ACP5GY_05000 [Vulcanisaeta sp.]
MALNDLRICWGVKVRGKKRLECGETVNNPEIVREVMKLINEFLNRIEKHKNVLLSSGTTPFDFAINAVSNWSSKAIVIAKSDEIIMELKLAEHNVGRTMIELLSQARERWLEIHRLELEELIRKLRSNEISIIITGEPFNSNKSFMVHLYTTHLAIEIERVAGAKGATIHMSLTGFKGTHIITPKLLADEKLRAMQYGLLLTDGSIHEGGYPIMSTNQLWQAVTFTLVFPGKVYASTIGLSLNEDDVGITWRLRAVDYKGMFKGRAEVAERVLELNDEDFMGFLLLAVLCDGDIDVKKRMIRLTMGESKRGLWGDVIERLVGYGFREGDDKRRKAYRVWESKAVDVARKMLRDPVIRSMIEDLSELPDAEKLKRLIRLADMEVRSLGRSMVEVVDGVWMSINVHSSGTIQLRVVRRNYEDAKKIWEKLREAGYDARLRKYGEVFVVRINMGEIERHPELAVKVCGVLRRLYEEGLSERSTGRAQSMAKVVERLGCRDHA